MSLHPPIDLFMSVGLLFPPQRRFHSACYKSFRNLADGVGGGMIRCLYFLVCPPLVLRYFIQFQQYLRVFDPISLGLPFLDQCSQFLPLFFC